MIRHPLPSAGSPGEDSPASTVLWDAPSPCRPSRRAWLPSLGGTAIATPFSCPAARAAPAAGPRGGDGPGVLLRRLPLPAMLAETTGIPRFLGNPDVDVPCSPTPAGPVGQAILGPTDAAFRSHNGVGSRDGRFFRGSMTRPAHWLSTLRSRDCSRTTQDSLPAAGQLCRVGLTTHWVPMQGLALHSAPPCPGFAWRTATFPGGTRQLTLCQIVTSIRE